MQDVDDEATQSEDDDDDVGKLRGPRSAVCSLAQQGPLA